MNQRNTPQEIIALIQCAEEEEEKQQAEAEALETTKAVEVRKEREAETTLLLDKVKHLIPDVLFPYLVFGERTGGRNEAWYEKTLEFQVPGLAPIAMVFTGVIRDDEEPKLAHWIVAGVSESDWDEDADLCKKAVFSLDNNHADGAPAKETNIRKVLWVAKKSFEDKESRQIELDQAIVRKHKRNEMRAQKEAKKISEEQALFDAIKNDPVAVHMLKAFILLRDERSAFEQRLEEMGDEMYGMENRWSYKAAELRRQADDAQRRANDELRRLENDLDDAESKLKKVQRGW
jgi:hypothetical protein